MKFAQTSAIIATLALVLSTQNESQVQAIRIKDLGDFDLPVEKDTNDEKIDKKLQENTQVLSQFPVNDKELTQQFER